jgi:S-formylglutathione hydrolase FrmB
VQRTNVDTATNNISTTIIASSQMHCNNPNMMNMDSMQAMDCDSGCCANCVSVSVALTTPVSVLFLPTLSIQPVSGTMSFYTRSISPELQPPLV